MTRFWDGRTDGRSDCTPRPAFAFGDAGKNKHQLRKCVEVWIELVLLFQRSSQDKNVK